jgi:ferredoxin-NADP reductase
MHKSKILLIEFVTHDVLRFIIEKPQGFSFQPGQSTLISINKNNWQDQKRPFTMTSLPQDLVLEFTIKIYPEHKGVTEQLSKLIPGDELIIENPMGSISYKGKGVFIAGGTGITPFLAIFRDLKNKNLVQGNKLIFSNKTTKDVILEKELKEMFQENLILTLTRENKQGYENKKIDLEFLKEHIDINNLNQNFYVCGPPSFTQAIQSALQTLGAKTESVVV